MNMMEKKTYMMFDGAGCRGCLISESSPDTWQRRWMLDGCGWGKTHGKPMGYPYFKKPAWVTIVCHPEKKSLHVAMIDHWRSLIQSVNLHKQKEGQYPYCYSIYRLGPSSSGLCWSVDSCDPSISKVYIIGMLLGIQCVVIDMIAAAWIS